VSVSYTMKHSIRLRILAILGVLAVGYMLLLGLAQFTAGATRGHMDHLSTSIFPAALKLREAESTFEQMTRSYKEAVLLEDPGTLAVADKDAEAVEELLTVLRDNLGGSPDLARNVDDLLTQFSSIRSRSHDTYGALLTSKDNATTDLQSQVFVLASDDRNFAAAMQALNESIRGQFHGETDAIDLWSTRSRVAGLAMLMIALTGCAGAWWVLQYKVLLPLNRLAGRMKAIAEGDGDLTDRVEVHGHDELDEVGSWFNVFIERIEEIVLRVTRNARALGEAASGLAAIAHETASQSAKQRDLDRGAPDQRDHAECGARCPQGGGECALRREHHPVHGRHNTATAGGQPGDGDEDRGVGPGERRDRHDHRRD
jgi:hypothetical protein